MHWLLRGRQLLLKRCKHVLLQEVQAERLLIKCARMLRSLSLQGCLDLPCRLLCCSRPVSMQQRVLLKTHAATCLVKRCYKTSVYRRIIQDQCLDACYSLLAAHVTSMSHLTSHPLRIRYDIGNVDPDYFDLNSGEVGRKLLSSTSKVINNTWSSSSNLALSSF